MKNLLDRRASHLVVHGIQTTLFVAAFCHLCGADSQRKKEAFLKGGVWKDLQRVFESVGVPCADRPPSDSTIGRLIRNAGKEQLEAIVLGLMASLPENETDQTPLYAVDGKARKAAITESGKCEIDVSVFDVNNERPVAKRVAGNKEGEAPVARELIREIADKLRPGTFTADAGISCRETAQLIFETGHDFLFAIKGNAGHLFDEMTNLPWDSYPVSFTFEEGHGRAEARGVRLASLTLDEVRELIPSSEYFPTPIVFARIDRHRTQSATGNTSLEHAFFVASEQNQTWTAPSIGLAARQHWAVENNLHRHRYVELGEDDLHTMSVESSRVTGVFLDLLTWLSGGCGRGIRYFLQQFRASPLGLLRLWTEL